ILLKVRRIFLRILNFLHLRKHFDFKLKLNMASDSGKDVSYKFELCTVKNPRIKHWCSGHINVRCQCFRILGFVAHWCESHDNKSIEIDRKNVKALRREVYEMGARGYIVDMRPYDEMYRALSENRESRLIEEPAMTARRGEEFRSASDRAEGRSRSHHDGRTFASVAHYPDARTASDKFDDMMSANNAEKEFPLPGGKRQRKAADNDTPTTSEASSEAASGASSSVS